MPTKLTRSIILIILLPLLAGLMAACGPAPAAVDADAIAATVVAQLQAEQTEALAAATATTAPTATPEPEPELVPAVNIEDPAAVAADLQTALVDVYQQANPAVVYIITSQGSGSGFVFDDAGHIVTNNHVIAGSSEYEIVFSSGERLFAELVGADVDSDLAVLKVEALPAGVPALALADAATLQVGQFVVAIGNPFGEEGSMSMGIISALGRSLPSQRALSSGSSYSLPGVIQTDAPINPGNSGGPLLTLAGEVAGINSALISATGTNSGVGYAIPVQAVQQIVPSLIADGAYAYPYMGVAFDNEVSLREQSVYDLPQTLGAYVLGVTEGGPAAAAGLRAANPENGRGGDLITAIDGQPVGDFEALNSYLVFHTKPGQTIELTVLRDGELLTLPLTLADRP